MQVILIMSSNSTMTAKYLSIRWVTKINYRLSGGDTTENRKTTYRDHNLIRPDGGKVQQHVIY